MDSKFTQQTTTDDILQDPKAYGAPTFEEFAKNPTKWRKSKEHLFEIATQGSSRLGSVVQKHIYYVEGVECESAEHAQRVMGDMGLDVDNLEMCIGLENLGGHKANAHIKFRTKKDKSNLILPGGM